MGAANTTDGTCGGESARERSYTWVAPFTGFVTVAVSGNWDQVLYIRSGSSSGSQIACVDQGSSSETTSFNAIQGTTYVIFVDGYQTQSGTFTLLVRRA